MKIVDTFISTIYVGAKEHDNNVIHSYKEIKNILQKYCNENPLCVTLKQTEYIYKDGYENGFEVGLINYPRFPETQENITNKALEIANILKEELNQYVVSIVCKDKTYMIE